MQVCCCRMFPTLLQHTKYFMSYYITSKKNEEYWQAIHEKGKLRAFLKDPLLNGLEITQLDQKPAKNNVGAAEGTHLKDNNKLGLVDSPGCNRCQQ